MEVVARGPDEGDEVVKTALDKWPRDVWGEPLGWLILHGKPDEEGSDEDEVEDEEECSSGDEMSGIDIAVCGGAVDNGDEVADQEGDTDIDVDGEEGEEDDDEHGEAEENEEMDEEWNDGKYMSE